MSNRNIFDIIESFRKGLRRLNSNFAEFSNYGNLYTLYRSIASVISAQEAELNTIKSSYFISTAIGSDLDDRASDFGISRKLGNSATGFVIVNTNIEIPSGTILTNVNTSIQFELQNKVNPNSSNSESIVPIKSINSNSSSNLPAGTRLYSSIYSNSQFVVGNYKNPVTKIVQGSLSGGLDKEDDQALRSRIVSFLGNRSKCTTSALISNILNVDSISKVYIKEHTPVTGYITIFVDSTNLQIIRQVQNIVNLNKAAGVCAIVKPIDVFNIKIKLSVNVDVNFSKQSEVIIAQIKSNVFDYISNVEVGGILSKESIAASVLSINGVRNCNIILPISNVQLKEQEVIKAEEINVTLNIN